MLKILSAALIAASLMIAPIASASAAQPATSPATTTKAVKLVKSHKRHLARHHARKTFVRHGRHMKRHHARHGKFITSNSRHVTLVKAHKHSHVSAIKSRVRSN